MKLIIKIMKYIKNKIIQLTLGLSVILLAISFTFANDNTKPIIKTESTPTSSSVFITYPEGFSGKVFTSCVNGVCNSTSSPISDKEIKEIQTRFEEQRKRMNEFFRQQEEFFNQIFKEFDIFSRFPGPVPKPNIQPSLQNDVKLTV
jgi:hypothetical protein